MSEVDARERQQAERIARDLVCDSPGIGAGNYPPPLTRGELSIVRSMAERLTRRPQTPREEVENIVAMVDLAGATSSARRIGLWDEFRDVARRHPAEFAEATGSDLAREATEAMIGGMRLPLSTSAALEARVLMIRDQLAGPKPSAVEFALAEAAAVAWLDFYRCTLQREQAGNATIRQLSYLDGRVDRAHRRYVRSLKALSAARRVDLSLVQVNINESPRPRGALPEA